MRHLLISYNELKMQAICLNGFILLCQPLPSVSDSLVVSSRGYLLQFSERTRGQCKMHPRPPSLARMRATPCSKQARLELERTD